MAPTLVIESNTEPLAQSRNSTPAAAKRERGHEENTKAKANRATIDTPKHMKKRRRAMNLAFKNDSNISVLPTRQDFGRSPSLAVESYIWGKPPPTAIQGNPTLRAPPPQIPDGMDDSPAPKAPSSSDDEYLRLPHVYQRKRPLKPKPPRQKQKPQIRAQKKTQKNDESGQSKQILRTRVKPNFCNIPAEIREEVYRHLLIAEGPIHVHGGWRMVYRRHRPHLSTSILAVSRKIKNEALYILYAENTFLYRLRDPTLAVTDVHSLLEDTSDSFKPIGEDEDEDSGSEYEGEASRSTTPRAARRQSAGNDWDINLDKFKCMFRNIIVEAEANRFSQDTQKSMAMSIEQFNQVSNYREGLSSNLRNVTIRVAPLRNRHSFDEHTDTFTFIDFFTPGSEVMKAIAGADCQFLNIELMTWYMIDSSERSGCRLKIDMRYNRIHRRVSEAGLGSDFWFGDAAMMEERKRRVAQSGRALAGLQKCIHDFCQQRVSRTVGGRNFLDWDEFSYPDDEIY